MEKCTTPLNESDIACRILRKEVHALASLKIRNILRDLNAAMTEKSIELDINDSSTISTSESSTIVPSNIFILSRKYSRNPKPISFITISTQKKIVKKRLAFSRDEASSSVSGYLSKELNKMQLACPLPAPLYYQLCKVLSAT